MYSLRANNEHDHEYNGIKKLRINVKTNSLNYNTARNNLPVIKRENSEAEPSIGFDSVHSTMEIKNPKISASTSTSFFE